MKSHAKYDRLPHTKKAVHAGLFVRLVSRACAEPFPHLPHTVLEPKMNFKRGAER
jgi:hypothetical protein